METNGDITKPSKYKLVIKFHILFDGCVPTTTGRHCFVIPIFRRPGKNLVTGFFDKKVFLFTHAM